MFMKWYMIGKGTCNCVNENSGEGIASFADGNKIKYSTILLQEKKINKWGKKINT